jgi:hypothetical protein
MALGVYEIRSGKAAVGWRVRHDPVDSDLWRRDGQMLVSSGLGFVVLGLAVAAPRAVATPLWLMCLGLGVFAGWRNPWRTLGFGSLYRDVRVLAWLVPTFFVTLIGVLLLVVEPASNWLAGIALVGAGAIGFSLAVRSHRRHDHTLRSADPASNRAYDL